MSSLNDQEPDVIIIRPLPLDGNNKEVDVLRAYMDSPIIIVPSYILKEGCQYKDIICPLIWCNKETKGDGCDRCSFCNCLLEKTTGYFKVSNKNNYTVRITRDLINRTNARVASSSSNCISNEFIVCFHKECIEPIQKNRYHPKHSLQALLYYLEEGRQCYCCYGNKTYFHSCYVCEFRICHECVLEQPLLKIKHQIRHKHTLNYIQRKASITCDICALNDERYFIYMCYQCDFVVHKECIYFPRTIRISGHDHQLNFTSSIYQSCLTCMICYDIYDGLKYGGYSCIDCTYFVHSKCAIYRSMWDGKELEEKLEDTTCSKCKSLPPSMRFHKEIYKKNEKEKQCQACALPIYDGDIFSCIKCDFVLHKVCARLPPMKMHPIHPHLLYNGINPGIIFRCSACKRVCNSFGYCCYEDCLFILDINCASIHETIDYHSHNHLLFPSSETGSSKICSICRKSQAYYLECEECDFSLCFGCATLPKKFMYKCDEHPLVFTFGQNASGQYWCDMCEEQINQKCGLYLCNDCNVALHVGCLCGEDMYMLPGRKDMTCIFDVDKVYEVDVKGEFLFNDRLTRYICKYCQKHCQYKLIFKNDNGDIFCSGSCLVISITGKDF